VLNMYSSYYPTAYQGYPGVNQYSYPYKQGDDRIFFGGGLLAPLLLGGIAGAALARPYGFGYPYPYPVYPPYPYYPRPWY
jgi:hypothetical protein